MKNSISLILLVILTAAVLCGCIGQKNEPNEELNEYADSVVFGNVITMDEKNSVVEAVAVKDGIITFVGSKTDAQKYIGKNTKVTDYGNNSVYPGFLESHTHGFFAGYRSIGQANLLEAGGCDYDKYREIIKTYIKNHPDNDFYVAGGWVEDINIKVTKDYLDEICPDKPLLMQTVGGHSCLLNTKALETIGMDAALAKKYGPDQVYVDENGEPTGYMCEKPAVDLIAQVPVKFEDGKKYLLNWQDTALQKGFTGVADAGELFFSENTRAYYELEQEGKLKLRTYSYLLVPDNAENPTAEINRIAESRDKYSGEYYKIVGAKAFLDGVAEAHSSWTVDEYADQPNYYGVLRFNDHDKMVELITAANSKNLSVHVHSEGDGATNFMLTCIEDAEKITGNMDQRNVLAHLHFVQPEDIQRMAKTQSVAVVPPLWTADVAGTHDADIKYFGKERADASYPIKSFIDEGAVIAFHSDYPVSPTLSVPLSVYLAEMRALPNYPTSCYNNSESISREQALRAMTTNVAYAWHEEDNIGSLEVGKLANMAVFDTDFLHDSLAKVAEAQIVATIVDGEVVYKA